MKITPEMMAKEFGPNWLEKLKEAKVLADKLSVDDRHKLLVDICSGNVSGKVLEKRAHRLGEKHMTHSLNIVFLTDRHSQ
ncbi:MAG: hypothetical protein QGH85_00845 [Candidatus Pacebacteria bacterium]|jgi:hypothetical protein|nr:hypothetical protein [Parcubacteria group bacterium]MDP6249466.1 hypothetical protein [Candidatus Paceibacterota bacterium]MDP7159552.1 hypothetical protein [Candidatus Paceibacterota bacterium]MDP7366271.1 hypothetical protein [Candidatus Paceibacterota bacterium]MDP7466160.1 hypothetical protein [Candidatus Paceibacterota bacterium]|tara:strand:+ start:432 stop:671 length:240 start_codon:yes stop_codon:yes gene_type:complete